MNNKFYEYPHHVDNKGAGIIIRNKQELSDNEILLLKQAELWLDSVETEAWTALGTNTQINYSAHGMFRYFGKFPSTIGTHLLMSYTKEFDQVMDPMAGSGTTVLESLLLNRHCKSYDVNPLSILLAKVKTTNLDPKLLKETLNYINQNYQPLSSSQFDWKPTGLRDADHWFLPKTQDSLRGLIKLIQAISDNNIKDFYTICLASCIRSVSKATTQQGRLFLDVSTAKEDCLEAFNKKALKNIDIISNIPKAETHLEIDFHDSHKPYDFIDLNDLIIVHPPYFNSYKYSSINSLELAWLGVDHSLVRTNEVREFFKIGKADKVSYYVEDMALSLDNIAKTLKKNGVLALMIGDTIIKGNYIKATKLLIDQFLEKNQNIIIEKIVLRVPKYTEASWTASQRRKKENVGISLNDFIIIFRRIS